MSGCFGSDIKVKEAITANNRDDRTLKNREQVGSDTQLPRTE